MKTNLFVLAVVCLFGLSSVSEAADRYTVRNGRGQVVSRVTTCVGGTCGRITDAAGRITGSFRVSGNNVRYYDRAGRPK
jgi:hypothetical protein